LWPDLQQPSAWQAQRELRQKAAQLDFDMYHKFAADVEPGSAQDAGEKSDETAALFFRGNRFMQDMLDWFEIFADSRTLDLPEKRKEVLKVLDEMWDFVGWITEQDFERRVLWFAAKYSHQDQRYRELEKLGALRFPASGSAPPPSTPQDTPTTVKASQDAPEHAPAPIPAHAQAPTQPQAQAQAPTQPQAQAQAQARGTPVPFTLLHRFVEHLPFFWACRGCQCLFGLGHEACPDCGRRWFKLVRLPLDKIVIPEPDFDIISPDQRADYDRRFSAVLAKKETAVILAATRRYEKLCALMDGSTDAKHCRRPRPEKIWKEMCETERDQILADELEAMKLRRDRRRRALGLPPLPPPTKDSPHITKEERP
jgi:hypothetical protein